MLWSGLALQLVKKSLFFVRSTMLATLKSLRLDKKTTDFRFNRKSLNYFYNKV
jgi:hypothetical protein